MRPILLACAAALLAGCADDGAPARPNGFHPAIACVGPDPEALDPRCAAYRAGRDR